ncbi:MAG TPA: hypothetical protein VIS94_11225 [Desulfomonilia bacterium]
MEIKKINCFFYMFIIFAASLSGCITSFSPKDSVVAVRPGETQVFTIKTSPVYQEYEWLLDGIRQNGTGNSYEYTPDESDTGEHEVRVIAGSDRHSWKVLVKSITWEKTYDVGSSNISYSSNTVLQTDDGGYVVAGITDSRLTILRLDSAGNRLWDRKLDNFYDYNKPKISIAQAKNGGFAVVLTQSIEVGYSDYEENVIAIKLDKLGNVEWSQYYIKNVESKLISFKKVTDGGYLLYANKLPVGLVLIKLDDDLMISWEINFESFGYPTEVIETDDGGFNVVFGEYYGINLKRYDSSGNFVWEKDNKYCSGFCNDSIIPADHGGFLIYSGKLTTKFDQKGDTQWEFKGITNPINRSDSLHTIKHANDGGYIIGGSSRLFPIEGYFCLPIYDCIAGICRWKIFCGLFPIKEFASDAWVSKIDSAGDFEWSRYYGDTIDNYSIESISQTSDGGFIAAGRKTSRDGSTNMFYVIKLDMNGNL